MRCNDCCRVTFAVLPRKQFTQPHERGGEYGVVNDSLHREGPEPAIVQGYVMGGKEELGAARAALLVALEIAAGLALERAPAAAPLVAQLAELRARIEAAADLFESVSEHVSDYVRGPIP